VVVVGGSGQIEEATNDSPVLMKSLAALALFVSVAFPPRQKVIAVNTALFPPSGIKELVVVFFFPGPVNGK